jgi:hypothetical protein
MYFQGQYPQILYANLPAAASNTNKVFLVTDLARGGTLFRSDGTNWLSLGGSVLLGSSAVPSSVTGTTAATTLATIAIPAALMGLNGQLKITTLWSAAANNANAKTGFVKLDTTLYQSIALASNLSSQALVHIRNRNSASSQVGWIGTTTAFGLSATGVTTSTVDTSIAKNIVIQGQLANSGDTLTLESYTVELMR